MSVGKGGKLTVVGLGPGEARFLTPEASAALDEADALYGYVPYLDRVPVRPGQTRHASDNREELARAGAALAHAAEGGKVAMVSGGDPGVFAMAAAVIEAIEAGPAEWRALELAVVPGITAMLAVAARCGAPLGHDFCAISLSDNLKPWELIEKRLRLAAQAGFAMAFYNPVSKARPHQLETAFDILREELPGRVPVIFGRAVGRADERLRIVPLANAHGRAAGPALAGLYAPSRRRCVMGEALQPCEHRVDAGDGLDLRARRAGDHDHLDAKGAGRRDLAIGRRAAAVLRQDGVDVVVGQQGVLVGGAEGAARLDIARMGHGEPGLDRINAAHEVMVLRRRLQRMDLIAPERHQHAAWALAELGDRVGNIGGLCPDVAGLAFPGGTKQGDKRHAGHARGLRGIARDVGGEGVSGVDQRVDAFRGEVCGHSRGTAKAAGACGDAHIERVARAAGKRQAEGEAAARGQRGAEFAGLAGAAQYEHAWQAIVGGRVHDAA